MTDDLQTRGELDVVHDDEVVEVLLDRFDLRAAVSSRKVAGSPVDLAVDRAVTKDAPLGVEEEVVAAFAGGERLDGVGDHSIEPACRVGAGDAEEGSVV